MSDMTEVHQDDDALVRWTQVRLRPATFLFLEMPGEIRNMTYAELVKTSGGLTIVQSLLSRRCAR